jgi:ribosomal protein S16
MAVIKLYRKGQKKEPQYKPPIDAVASRRQRTGKGRGKRDREGGGAQK